MSVRTAVRGKQGASSANTDEFGSGVGPGTEFMPRAKESHSDYVTRTMGDKLLKENPEHSREHVQQNKAIYWMAFSDWSRENVAQLKTTIYEYMADQNAWIFDFFPIELTKSLKFQQTHFDVQNKMPNIAVRKVPNRLIHATTYKREGNSIYTGQGFSMDYHFMKTPDGMAAWDRMVEALTANLWSFVIYQAMHELVFEPEYYRRMEQLYPFDSVPRNVNELFELENSKKFVLNKLPQGQHELVSDSSRIMLQKNVACTGLILSRDTMWYMHGRDPTQIFYDKSGPVALTSRTSMGEQKTLDGVTLYPVPVAQGKLHDSYLEPLLEYTVQHGSFWRFDDKCTDPKTYRSDHRSRRFASVSLNGMKKYTLLDVLMHVPEFHPLDPGEDDCVTDLNADGRVVRQNNNMSGKINRDLLYQLIDNREMVFKERLRTQLTGNEDKLNVLVRYISINGRKEYYPIHVYGEMADSTCKDKHFTNAYATMARAMFEGIDPQATTKLEKGMRLARELNTFSDQQGKEFVQSYLKSKPVRACVDVHKRMAGDDADLDFFGCQMLQPNQYGGMDVDAEAMGEKSDKDDTYITPFGFGTISGFLSLIDIDDNISTDLFKREMMQTIRDFVAVYRQMIDNLRTCCPDHPGLSPKMIPFYHNSANMTDDTRIMVAAWYSLFAGFTSPLIINGVLTQLTGVNVGNTLKITENNDAVLGFKSSVTGTYTSGFATTTVSGVPENIYNNLAYIHPGLPQGNIDETGQSDEYKRNNKQYYNIMYTRDIYEQLSSNGNRLLQEYPAFVMHNIANPVFLAPDMLRRYNDSFNKQFLMGVAARVVLLTEICLQSITGYFDNDISIPLGAMAMRPHETQGAHCAIALASGQIGKTYFSGYDNTVSFDPNAQHYDVQAFCWMKAMVADNKKYHMLPMVRGGNFEGGKGHLFVNQITSGKTNRQRLITDAELVEEVSRCNGRALGDYSIIAGLCSYNSACEKNTRTHLDVRNTYRPENFVGRLTNAPDDFVTQSKELHYSCAPILNYLFEWDNGEGKQRQDSLNFVQMMKRAARNYHIHEGVTDVNDPVKGWVRMRGHGVWGNTEVENCRQIQTSHASVVKAVS